MEDEETYSFDDGTLGRVELAGGLAVKTRQQSRSSMVTTAGGRDILGLRRHINEECDVLEASD